LVYLVGDSRFFTGVACPGYVAVDAFPCFHRRFRRNNQWCCCLGPSFAAVTGDEVPIENIVDYLLDSRCYRHLELQRIGFVC